MTLLKKFEPIFLSNMPPVIRDKRLLLDSDKKCSIYYAPFEYMNPSAKIVLVGITPGPTQMVNANNEARRALLAGKNHEITIKQAKDVGGFSGEPMRSNLINQLNHWNVHKWLGLQDSAELFHSSINLLQTTSLLRYPVFVDDKAYRGTPNMLKQTLLKKYLFDYFVSEIKKFNDAVFFTLGPEVKKVIDSLIKEGAIEKDKVITGLTHPSPNCTYRIKYLIGKRNDPVPYKTNPEPYDQGLIRFRERFLLLK